MSLHWASHMFVTSGHVITDCVRICLFAALLSQEDIALLSFKLVVMFADIRCELMCRNVSASAIVFCVWWPGIRLF